MNCRQFRDKYECRWKLGIGDLHSPLRFVSEHDMKEHRVEETDGRIREFWKGSSCFGDLFEVVACWRERDGAFFASLEYSGYAGTDFIEEIHFPILKADYGPESEYISGAWDLGFIRRGDTAFPPGSRTVLPYCSMQFSALNSASGGFYVEHRDPEWFSKRADIEISPDGNVMRHSSVFSVACGKSPEPAGRIPYEIRMSDFSGNWFAAAVMYRSWALEQAWHRARTAENPLRKIGMWVWNRGLADDVMAPVERLQKDCGEVPVALDWYWWHGNPYDTDYPDFWPPREGVGKFEQSVRRMKSQGIYTQVYVNGVCWDMDGGSWSEGGEDSVVILRDGTPLATAFNRYNKHRLAYLCGEAPRFHDRLSELLSKLRAAGLDGQYLDMVGCSTYYCCYNPHHRHPSGGGNSSRNGYRAMLSRLKRENPDYPLTIECANEAYMDLTDGAIVCNAISAEHFGENHESVPLFCAVYHGRYALFGNYAFPDGIPPWDPLWPSADKWKTEQAWHRLYPDQFYFEMARPVVWGIQPMVCNLKKTIQEDPEFREIYRFILNSASFYHANRKFLFDGEMLSPGGFECGRFEVAFHCRMIFTKENECRTVRKIRPSVLHSCWKAPDGERVLILANYTGSEQHWKYGTLAGEIAPHSYGKIALSDE